MLLRDDSGRGRVVGGGGQLGEDRGQVVERPQLHRRPGPHRHGHPHDAEQGVRRVPAPAGESTEPIAQRVGSPSGSPPRLGRTRSTAASSNQPLADAWSSRTSTSSRWPDTLTRTPLLDLLSSPSNTLKAVPLAGRSHPDLQRVTGLGGARRRAHPRLRPGGGAALDPVGPLPRASGILELGRTGEVDAAPQAVDALAAPVVLGEEHEVVAGPGRLREQGVHRTDALGERRVHVHGQPVGVLAGGRRGNDEAPGLGRGPAEGGDQQADCASAEPCDEGPTGELRWLVSIVGVVDIVGMRRHLTHLPSGRESADGLASNAV